VSLLALLAYRVWRVLEPVWHPVAWTLLLGTFLAPLNRRATGGVGGRQN